MKQYPPGRTPYSNHDHPLAGGRLDFRLARLTGDPIAFGHALGITGSGITGLTSVTHVTGSGLNI